jgi:predicted enzyme related to lactoylglutathione lyase
MSLRFVQWTIDVVDVEGMAAFWSAALGYQIDQGDDGCAKLYPPAGSSDLLPTVWLQNTGTRKGEKNHNHPDLRPADGDVEAEVQRVIALGARQVDVGQTASDPFVVLADPEGNEFCVLRRDPSRAPARR